MRWTGLFFGLVVALASLTVAGCGDDGAAAPFYNAGDDTTEPPDGGADGGHLDLNNASGNQTGEPADDFVSPWATIKEPDKLCLGFNHACVLLPNKHIACWGDDGVGQATPPKNQTFVRLACGDAHTCGITEQGEVLCWGAGTVKEVTPGHYAQALPPAGKFKEIACGAAHSCAIDETNNIVCWGAGHAKATNGIAPDFAQAIAPVGKFWKITAGEAHTCAIRGSDRAVLCWGGIGETGDCWPPRSYACGQTDGPAGRFTQVSAGLAHTCALREDGVVKCWGAGGTDTNCDPLDGASLRYECGQSMPPAGEFVRVEAGWHHTCVVDAAYVATCFGWDFSGSTKLMADVPYAQAVAGESSTCAARRNSVIDCIGGNVAGVSTVPPGIPGEL